MGKFEDILREREEADRKVIKSRSKQLKGNKSHSGEKDISTELREGGLAEVNRLIREHGIVRVERHKDDGTLIKKERVLQLLDKLYERGMSKSDVRAIVEYLNRTAGAVSQVIDFHDNKKKLIVLGTGKTEEESKAKEAVAVKET